ncbi:glycosyltransferase family 4 protein [Segnochrobactrum spirostomi]|uniref:glycosyltransferase family 4 protein n=1 Tax=Segnochrobactrum spirostomi TaxID=2608987 RepID=UPI001AD807B1|nr:glycosyltransferase family 4 protein [Segnochrobactrum spirostomi]
MNYHAELPATSVRVHRNLNYTGLSIDHGGREERLFRSEIIQFNNISNLRIIIEEFNPDQILLCNINGLGSLGVIVFLCSIGFQPSIYLGDNFIQELSGREHLRDTFYRLFSVRRALQTVRPIVVSRLVLEEAENALAARFSDPLFVPGWVPKSAAPDQIELREGPLKLVYSSRIAPHKGIWILLGAVKHLLACGDDNFVIDVYGAGQTAELIQRVHAAGLSDYIRYLGAKSRSEMIALFAQYDALLFPTWEREPLGLVPFEAAAAGCVPIITAQIGAAEWLTSNESIKIERSVEALAGAVQCLLTMPAGERLAWRRAISQNIIRRYNADLWVNKIEQLLQTLPCRAQTISPLQAQDAMLAMLRIWRN